MSTRIAINGFGRIGRLVLRAFFENHTNKDIEVVAINDLASPEANAHLFKYDSVHGMFPGTVEVQGNSLVVNGHAIRIYQCADPADLPWAQDNVHIVLECSGRFTSKSSASAHLKAGAKRVLISAPADEVDLTVVYGVNHDKISNTHTVISNASCTTNCLAPLAHTLHRAMGIEHGYMTTIHAYTGDQRLVDTNHSDLRRSRAAALSMIPTSTGAARAVGLVIPELKGKLDGTAIRVPTPNVSVVDFKFVAKRDTSVEEVNNALIAAGQNDLQGVLLTLDAPLVSSDFNHNPFSSICDTSQTCVLDQRFVRILSWYDNEWGFSNRMLDVTATIAGTLSNSNGRAA